MKFLAYQPKWTQVDSGKYSPQSNWAISNLLSRILPVVPLQFCCLKKKKKIVLLIISSLLNHSMEIHAFFLAPRALVTNALQS